MRKAQKKQAEDFVRLLADAHNELKKYIENKNYEPAADLLGECQRGAIELGGLIEKTEGEDQHTVLLLEEYCESIYQLYEQISGNQEVQANKLYKRLRQALIRVENSIKNDIKVRLEIAFMPYKASMWDSLESIWEAAKEDPDCDAYVVPIPYYDRNSDYSLGQCHYEGEKFPDYVEIVDYHTYHLENRRPDIIYIHNPYDEHNYVTSVDPQYYSYKLKDYTEQLVYVPYCIYEEPAKPDSKETIEYCSRYVTSGILNADKVIVQSENFRRALINALVVYRGMDRGFWEKKVIALGSPKHDKVTNEDMNKLHIPESWEKLIKRPDGSRKRVVFYNTSLNALLRYGEQMTRKIRSGLRFFYENRETCILLWRPHPLVQATIESMRPELWAEYKKITDTYRKEGWGIYDDTPDFHAAFAVSDAYYGDYSSLLLLYQETWKPVLQQNADILDYRKRFVTDRLYYDGEYVWGTAREFNGLFRINPETFEIKYMGQFPNENPEGCRLFYGIAECSGKLYFCSHNAKYIGVYDKVSKEFSSIALKEDIKDRERKFSGISVFGKFVYLYGGRANTIVQLDTESNKIIYIEDWIKEIVKHQEDYFDYHILSGCIYNGSLYCPGSGTKGILRISLIDLSYEFISYASDSADCFADIINQDETLWLRPDGSGFISKLDLRTRILEKMGKINESSSVCKINGDIYYFSVTEPYFYKINIESEEMVKIPAEEGIYSVCPAGDEILMTTYLTGNLYVFNTVSMETLKVEMTLKENDFLEQNDWEILRGIRGYNQYALESGYVNLKKILEGNLENRKQKSGAGNTGCGKKIHEKMKGLIE